VLLLGLHTKAAARRWTCHITGGPATVDSLDGYGVDAESTRCYPPVPSSPNALPN
jgi:hypothetical protein